MAVKVDVFVDEDHFKVPTLYWLPKLKKRPKSYILLPISSSCTTT